jgi:hypothetical protein
MPTPTTTYALNKPTVGGDDNVWGTEINSNLDKLDDLLDGTLSITPNLGTGWEVGGVAVTASAAELNILDGVTASTAEINLLDGVTYTLTDINGLTASIAELTTLDGITASTAELNLLDGAVDHATADWEAGTATAFGLPSPADVKAAIDALASTESIVLLGTVNTTSGSTQTLSGLDLTSYKQVQAWVDGVDPSTTATTANITIAGLSLLPSSEPTSSPAFGFMLFDFGSGQGFAINRNTDRQIVGTHTLTTASTSISVTTTQTFASGSVRIYGVK